MKMGLKNFAIVGAAAVGIAVISCSPHAPKLLPKPEIEVETVKTQSNKYTFNPRVDIIFVVDDSGSMSSHQANLAANVDKFTQDIQRNKLLDYHIGVVTSSASSFSGGASPCCGRLVGNPKYIERSTPNGMRVLAENLKVGINGDATEMFFDPVKLALENPNLTGHNAGFYRDDAFLVVVFITDAEDQGTQSATDFYDFLLRTKRGDRSKVLLYGSIIPGSDSTCPQHDDAWPPNKIEQVLKMGQPDPGKENYFVLCDPNFGGKLAELGVDLGRRVGRVMTLDRPADPGSIKVVYGSSTPGQQSFVIPNDERQGWTYDSAQNAIVFGSDIDWSAFPIGLRVEVTFNTAKME